MILLLMPRASMRQDDHLLVRQLAQAFVVADHAGLARGVAERDGRGAGLALAPFRNTVKPPSTLSTQRTMASMSCVLLMKPCAPAW